MQLGCKSDHQDSATDAESNDDLSVDSTIAVTTTPSDLHLDLIPIIEIWSLSTEKHTIDNHTQEITRKIQSPQVRIILCGSIVMPTSTKEETHTSLTC